MSDLPVIAVGDVHGDLERLFKALKPYPPDRWHTVFLGDLVDGGPFGVGALRYARDRPNSTMLLGNHEVMMLWVLRDPARLPYWQGIGGEPHDLEELRGDPGLQEWLRRLPLLHRRGDVLFQHSDTDLYARLLEPDDADPVEAVNRRGAALLAGQGEPELWDLLSPGRIFPASRTRLEAWLELNRCQLLVHGHKPHGHHRPHAYHDGLAVNYDGSLSRYRMGGRFRRHAPVEASVGPVDF